MPLRKKFKYTRCRGSLQYFKTHKLNTKHSVYMIKLYKLRNLYHKKLNKTRLEIEVYRGHERNNSVPYVYPPNAKFNAVRSPFKNDKFRISYSLFVDKIRWKRLEVKT